MILYKRKFIYRVVVYIYTIYISKFSTVSHFSPNFIAHICDQLFFNLGQSQNYIELSLYVRSRIDMMVSSEV